MTNFFSKFCKKIENVLTACSGAFLKLSDENGGVFFYRNLKKWIVCRTKVNKKERKKYFEKWLCNFDSFSLYFYCYYEQLIFAEIKILSQKLKKSLKYVYYLSIDIIILISCILY